MLLSSLELVLLSSLELALLSGQSAEEVLRNVAASAQHRERVTCSGRRGKKCLARCSEKRARCTMLHETDAP